MAFLRTFLLILALALFARAEIDLELSGSAQGTFMQGESGQLLTFVISNIGDDPTDGSRVLFKEELPSGFVLESLSGSGWSCSASTYECTRSDVLQPGNSYPTITLRVTVARNAAVSITNTASISGGGDQVFTNNVFNTHVGVKGMPDLQLRINHPGDGFGVGQVAAQYDLTVRNIGQGPSSGTITVQNFLPSPLIARNMFGAGWTCVVQTLTCTRSTVLQAGAEFPSITLLVDVPSTTTETRVVNRAVVSGGNDVDTSNNEATDPTNLMPVPDLTITMGHSGAFTQGGSGGVFTMTVQNVGRGSTQSEVNATLVLGSGLVITSISGAGWVCETEPEIWCQREDSLGAGASYPTITARVRMTATAAMYVTSTGIVSGGGELNMVNNVANEEVQVGQVSNLVVVSHNMDNFQQNMLGAVISLTVTNMGSGPSSGEVTVVDKVPAGLTPVKMYGIGWNCDFASKTCKRSDALPAGASFQNIELVVNVDFDAPDYVTNVVTVSGGGDLVLDDNTHNHRIRIGGVGDLVVDVKQLEPVWAQGAKNRVYELTVKNRAESATDKSMVFVSVALPQGLSVVSFGSSDEEWTCSVQALSCTRQQPLEAGKAYPAIALTVDVDISATSPLLLRVNVVGGGELNTENGATVFETEIVQNPDLSVQAVPRGVWKQGAEDATAIVTVKNSGGGRTRSATSVSLAFTNFASPQDQAEALKVYEMKGDGWTCTLATMKCEYKGNVDEMTDFPAITLKLALSPSCPTTLILSSQVSGGGEIRTDNNESKLSISVQALPDLVPEFVRMDETLTHGQKDAVFMLTVKNEGDGATESTSYPLLATMTFPPGLTVTKVTGDTWTCKLSDAATSAQSLHAASNVLKNAGARARMAANTAVKAKWVRHSVEMMAESSTGVAGTDGEGVIASSSTGAGSDSDSVPAPTPAPTNPPAASSGSFVSCTSRHIIPGRQSAPVITLLVDVSATASLSDKEADRAVAEVSGGGEINTANNKATDKLYVPPPSSSSSMSDALKWSLVGVGSFLGAVLVCVGAFCLYKKNKRDDDDDDEAGAVAAKEMPKGVLSIDPAAAAAVPNKNKNRVVSARHTGVTIHASPSSIEHHDASQDAGANANKNSKGKKGQTALTTPQAIDDWRNQSASPNLRMRTPRSPQDQPAYHS